MIVPLDTTVEGRTVRIGIAGLGIATRQVLPGLDQVGGVTLTGVADTRTKELANFSTVYPGVNTYTSVEALAASDDVDAIWIATPNHLHAEHTIAAARQGKHVICEKPMAVTMDEADEMVAAVEAAGVLYVQGHSKIYRTAVRMMGKLVADGRIGALQHISTMNYNDWLRRPVTSAEVDETRGGGVTFRQGPHQIDIVRYIGGGLVEEVYASFGQAQPEYPIEGHYVAHLRFQSGAVASLVFNGYGFFDVRELTWNVGEGGKTASEETLRGPRRPFGGPIPPDEKYADPSYSPDALQTARYDVRNSHDFFGLTICSGSRGDLRQSPEGLLIYDEAGTEEIAVPPDKFRNGELIELRDAYQHGRRSFPDEKWGRATLEIVLAIRESAKSQRPVTLHHQTAVPDDVSLPLIEA